MHREYDRYFCTPETEEFSMDTRSLKVSKSYDLPHRIPKLLFFNPRSEALSAIEEAGNPPNTAVCYQQSWSQADKSRQNQHLNFALL